MRSVLYSILENRLDVLSTPVPTTHLYMSTYRGGYTHDNEDWNLNTSHHGLTDDLLITNVVVDIKNSDPRARDEEFRQAITKKVEEISKWQVWKVPKKNAVLDIANVIGEKIVMVFKNVVTPQKMLEARHTSQDFSNNMKHEIEHNVNSLQPTSVRAILSTAANLGFRLYCHDMGRAYLQFLAPLSREE